MAKFKPLSVPRGSRVHMTCSKETKNYIMTECIKEFKKANPHLKDIEVTQGYILQRIARYYVEHD